MTEQQRKNVEIWIKALRSGKYLQGFKALKTVTRIHKRENSYDSVAHCCLGVALEIFAPECFVEERTTFVDKDSGTNFLNDDRFSELFGLKIGQTVLARKNDKGETFDQIADYLEGLLKKQIQSK